MPKRNSKKLFIAARWQPQYRWFFSEPRCQRELLVRYGARWGQRLQLQRRRRETEPEQQRSGGWGVRALPPELTNRGVALRRPKDNIAKALRDITIGKQARSGIKAAHSAASIIKPKK